MLVDPRPQLPFLPHQRLFPLIQVLPPPVLGQRDHLPETYLEKVIPLMPQGGLSLVEAHPAGLEHLSSRCFVPACARRSTRST